MPKIPDFTGTKRVGITRTGFYVKCGGDNVPCCLSVLFTPVAHPSQYWTESYRFQYAWGYDGEAARLLAITILSAYAGAPVRPHYSGQYFCDINPALQHSKSYCKQHPDKYLGDDFIMSHYEAFASEVIANLPDNWTLTHDDIDKWVKSKQPKEQCSRSKA